MKAHILGQLLGYDFSDSPHVQTLLGEPQQMHDRAMLYLMGYFTDTAREMPVLVLLEDLHWADDSSLDALTRLGLELQKVPVLVVMASRPELYERRPHWFEGRDFHRRINLKPLSRRINRQLVNEVLQYVEDIPEELSNLILNNAEGNPFYVEELVKVLVESEVIVKGDPLWQVDESTLAELDIPTTLTGVLQARLERLPKEEFKIIQQASVVGRVFWDQAVWYMNHQAAGALKEIEIQDGLSNLRGREMIYHRDLSTFIDAHEFIFKHAVLREVTYESVLKKLRKRYHSLAAEWLMEQRADRSREVSGLIADHLDLAGENDEALRYLELAGRRAADKYANDESIDYFTRALALVPDDDIETRFNLLLAREGVLDVQAKRDMQRKDLEALELLAEELKSREKALQIATRWSQYHWETSDFPASSEKAEEVLSGANLINNSFYTAWGHLMWGRASIRMDQPKIATEHLKQALENFIRIGDKRMEGFTLRSLGLVAGDIGDYHDWQNYSQKALSIARQIDNKEDEAEAINHLGNIAFDLGEFKSALDYFHTYLDLTQGIGNKYQERMANNNLGAVANNMGDYPAAHLYYSQALYIAQSTNDPQGEVNAHNGLGKAQFGLNQCEKSAQSFQKALELLSKYYAEWGISEVYTGLARIAMKQGDFNEALGFVDEVLSYLKKGESLDYELVYPIENILVSAQVLFATGDPRACEVLDQGYKDLQRRADKIKDPAMRKSFLENVPSNRDLMKLWSETNDSEK